MAAVGLALAAVATACSGGGSSPGGPNGTRDWTPVPDGGIPTTAAGTADRTTGSTPGTAPVRRSIVVTGQVAVNPGIRQGVARAADVAGWVLSTNNALVATTDDPQVERGKADPAIPADLAARSYDHVGDVDVDAGILWAPIEKDDKAAGTQVIARYDPTTLAFVGAQEVPQHHASFVAAADGIVYSADFFDDDAITRYRWDGTTLQPLAPLAMSTTVKRIQGGDVADGALWLSTDDEANGLYRVDLTTGDVQSLGSVGHVEGEGEGIDATPQPSGLLHVLVGDEASIGMWLVDVRVVATPG
ncbi:MAG: hypothetical protein U0Q07_11410 [Acidimicrobiales bacterium]